MNTTKIALEASLKELLKKKPFDKITIADLTEDCGISRMAFYYHFKDIYDLVEWACVEDGKKALRDKKTYDTWQEGFAQIFEAVLENKPFIMNVYHSVRREIRPEATGYGAVYFAAEMLKTRDMSFEGRKVLISGSGNVAQYAVKKATELGAKVLSVSDSNGSIIDPDGIDAEKLAFIQDLKNVKRGRIKEYAAKFTGAKYYENQRPWQLAKCDVAMPCATQNELDLDDAKALVAGGCFCVCDDTAAQLAGILAKKHLI